MKTKTNCFIDEQGRVYKTETLMKAATDLPVIEYQIDTEILLEELLYWQLKNFRDYLAHYRRVTEADLTQPIILRADGYIMDGWHRIIKALYQGLKSLPAKQFIINPEPDYINSDLII